MELVIPLLIGYILSGLEKPKKIIFAFIAIILTASLFLSLSRVGILCFLGSIIFMLTLLRLRKVLKSKAKFIYLLVAISFILLLVMGIDPLLDRFRILFRGDIFGRENRPDIWRNTLQIIRDFPLSGVGLGTFRNIYPLYKTLTVQVPVFYAHSDFLQLISETGLIGAGLAVWFLVIFFRDIYLVWLARHNPFVKGIALGGLAGILAILLHSFFDFNLQIPANAFLLTVIIALTYKSVSLKFNEDEPIRKI
jgi:O-antigen ligase